MIESIKLKTCTNTMCNKTLPATQDFFYKQKTKNSKGVISYKLASWCKECSIKKAKKYRSENIDICRKRELTYYHSDPERKERKKEGYRKHAGEHREEYILRLAAWFDENPEKSKEYNRYREMHKHHEISPNEWEDCKNYFNYRCAYCGLAVENHYVKRKNKYIHHDLNKDHFINDGENDLSNSVPACRSCNSSKNTRDFFDWYNEMDFYSEDRLLRILKWINEDYIKYIQIDS